MTSAESSTAAISPARKRTIIAVFMSIAVMCVYFTATFIATIENVEAVSETMTGTIESHTTRFTFGRRGGATSWFTVRLENGETVKVLNRGALPANSTGNLVVSKGKGNITGRTKYIVNIDKTRELRY